jgi:hypothetical protein
MKLSKGNPWGMVTGRISMSPEQALRTFGFVMSPTAQGIMIRHYKAVSISGHIRHEFHISNYKDHGNPQTPAQTINRDKFKMISFVAWQRPLTLIKAIWNPLATARRKNRGHGYNEFRSVNMHTMANATDLTHLLISDGDLEPAEILTAEKLGLNYYRIKWNPETTKNGLPTDTVYGFIYFEENKRMVPIDPAESTERSVGIIWGETEHDPGIGRWAAYVFFSQP